ncbi:sensor domain-containing diguanylate cyclase [Alteromonas facilis]|uniref:GGDEF domain-containing protein n=1 Tax=Alteromonas facilis TaxID=2048004 RepID=UPI000C28877B|nr:GGDEF domain-containing protein [Alteromonas facilis]
MHVDIELNKSWAYVSAALRISRKLGSIALFVGLVVMIGYSLGISFLYRPIEAGVATHPISGCLMILLGVLLSLDLRHQFHKPVIFIVCCAAILISITPVLDHVLNTSLRDYITPFLNTVVNERSTQNYNDIGINTAIMMLCLASSVLAFLLRHGRIAQGLALLAVMFPLLAIYGYAFSLTDYYGYMSLTTATGGFLLSFSLLCLTAEYGIVKAILSPYFGGRVARLQIVLIISLTLIISFLFIKTIQSVSGDIVGAMFAAFYWFMLCLVGLTAVAIEKVDKSRREKSEMLINLASTDFLTGLSNRRDFFEEAEYLMSHNKRSKEQMWCLFIDADNFKSINDNYGHDIGDHVLRQIAKIITRNIRETDIAARLGGEEFAILLTHTDRSGALSVAELIRRSIEEYSFNDSDGNSFSVTVSIGVSLFKVTEHFKHALAAADRALYLAKSSGKNTIQSAE